VHCAALYCAVNGAHKITMLSCDLCLVTLGNSSFEPAEERADARNHASVLEPFALGALIALSL